MSEEWQKLLNFRPSFAQLWRHLPSSHPPPSSALPGTPSYDLKGHVAYVQKLWRSYPLHTEHACEEHTTKLLREAFTPRAPWMIGGALLRLVRELYTDNDLYLPREPTLEYPPYLKRLQTRLSSLRFIEEADRVTLRFLRTLIDNLPASAFEDARDLTDEQSLPLSTLLPHLSTFPDFILSVFYLPDIEDEPIFYSLKSTLLNNMIRASGFDPSTYDGKRPLKALNDYPGTADAKVTAYLADTPFLGILADHIPFTIPEATYRKHGIILAPPGHGKTQLLGTLIARFLGTSTPLIVLDPHGDLFENLRQRVDPSRLILLDPDTNPPALNFLDFGNASQVEILQTFTYLMSSLSGGLSDKQGAVVPYLLKLLQKIPNASIETLRLLVDEKVKKPSDSQFYDKIKSLDVVDQGFFEHQFYSGRMQETKDAIGWKLYAALTSDAFREMFSAPKNEFDASAAIRGKKIVLVKGSERTLGETGLPVFLQFIVSQFFLAALKRAVIPEKDRHLAVIFADEASHIFNHQTTRILTECRKYGLGFLAATQLVEQIPTEVKAAVYGATAIKIAGPVSHTDAQLLAREMHATGDFIRSLKAVERSHAEFAFYVSGLTDKAVKVTVPYGTLEALPRINTAPYVPKPKAAKPETLSPPSPPDDDIVW